MDGLPSDRTGPLARLLPPAADRPQRAAARAMIISKCKEKDGQDTAATHESAAQAVLFFPVCAPNPLESGVTRDWNSILYLLACSVTNAATPSNFDSAGSAGNHGCATSGAGLPMPVDRGCSGGFRFEKCRNAGKPAKLPTQMLHRPCVSIEHPATSCSALAGPRIATNHRNFWRCDRPQRTGFCCSHVDYIRPSKTAHIAQTGDSVASYGSLPPLRLAHTWARTSRPDN